MILYSIVPPEKIFEQPFAERTIREIDGGFVEGCQTESGFAVSRLCSTDLKKYLDPHFSPGAIL